jgi:hypothetical protein
MVQDRQQNPDRQPQAARQERDEQVQAVRKTAVDVDDGR